MKKLKLTPLVLLSLLVPSFIFAALPSQDVIDRVQSRMEALKSNPDSQQDLEALFSDIEAVTQKYGIEGTAWVAYHDSVLLESFIKPEFMGLENIAIPLLGLADNEEQLSLMLVELVRAQVVIHSDPTRVKHVKILEKGASVSPIAAALGDTRIKQIVAEALTAGIEKGEADVEAALSLRTTIMLLERLRDILADRGASSLIPLINRIISRLELTTF